MPRSDTRRPPWPRFGVAATVLRGQATGLTTGVAAGLALALVGLLTAVYSPDFATLHASAATPGAALAVESGLDPSAATDGFGDGPGAGYRATSEGGGADQVADQDAAAVYQTRAPARSSRDRSRAAAIATEHGQLRSLLIERDSDDVRRADQDARRANRDAVLDIDGAARSDAARDALQAKIAAEQQARIAAIQAQAKAASDLRAALLASAATTSGSSYDLPVDYVGVPDSGAAASPISNGVVGAKFGQTGLWATYHTGLDYRASYGTPVHAAADGIVVYAGNDNTWSGNHVAVRHADNSTTMYSHLSVIDARAGEQVHAGDVIGLVGQTGRAFGAHLHFEVYPPGVKYGDVYHAVDPLPWLRARGIPVA